MLKSMSRSQITPGQVRELAIGGASDVGIKLTKNQAAYLIGHPTPRREARQLADVQLLEKVGLGNLPRNAVGPYPLHFQYLGGAIPYLGLYENSVDLKKFIESGFSFHKDVNLEAFVVRFESVRNSYAWVVGGLHSMGLEAAEPVVVGVLLGEYDFELEIPEGSSLFAMAHPAVLDSSGFSQVLGVQNRNGKLVVMAKAVNGTWGDTDLYVGFRWVPE